MSFMSLNPTLRQYQISAQVEVKAIIKLLTNKSKAITVAVLCSWLRY